MIEYPADLIDLSQGNNVETSDFRKEITNEGFLRLLWKKSDETLLTKNAREIEYIKIAFLKVIHQKPSLLRYQEKIRIKAKKTKVVFTCLYMVVIDGLVQ